MICTGAGAGLQVLRVARRYVETLEQKVRRLEQELKQRDERASPVASVHTLRPPGDEALIQDFHSRNPRSRPRTVPVENTQPIFSDVNSASLEKEQDVVKVIKYGKPVSICPTRRFS